MWGLECDLTLPISFAIIPLFHEWRLTEMFKIEELVQYASNNRKEFVIRSLKRRLNNEQVGNHR